MHCCGLSGDLTEIGKVYLFLHINMHVLYWAHTHTSTQKHLLMNLLPQASHSKIELSVCVWYLANLNTTSLKSQLKGNKEGRRKDRFFPSAVPLCRVWSQQMCAVVICGHACLVFLKEFQIIASTEENYQNKNSFSLETSKYNIVLFFHFTLLVPVSIRGTE